MTPELIQSFQEQYTQERTNEAIYTRFAEVMDNLAWDGFAKHFHKAADEERGHAQGIADFLVDLNVEPIVAALPTAPQARDVTGVFKAALALEEQNTLRLAALCDAAMANSDYIALEFLLPYMKEQRVSVREYTDITIQLDRAGGDNAAILQLDERLGGG